MHQASTTSPNVNAVMFHDDVWPYSADQGSVLALTTVTYHPETGEIWDVDIEINSAENRITISEPVPADGWDLESILTHETGHFFGLAHTPDPNATMNCSYSPGSVAKRVLDTDDVAGICAAYPPDGTRVVGDGGAIPSGPCDPTPRNGLGCAGEANAGCGCGVVGVAGSACAGLASVGVAVVLTARRRRRRQGSRRA
jgi:hypothetical protein